MPINTQSLAPRLEPGLAALPGAPHPHDDSPRIIRDRSIDAPWGETLPDWVWVPSAPRPALMQTSASNPRHLVAALTPAPPFVAALTATPARSQCLHLMQPGSDLRALAATPRLDKHAIDIALSIGRHAVERAKLAGVDWLVASALPNETAARADDLYAAMTANPPALPRRDARLPALIGISLSAAQIGIPLVPRDAMALAACRIAIELSPDIAHWVHPNRPASIRP